tara:strand:+ start:3150 stop:3707 length:558 start_codon:yes stop_codon:yes gene_type:complete
MKCNQRDAVDLFLSGSSLTYGTASSCAFVQDKELWYKDNLIAKHWKGKGKGLPIILIAFKVKKGKRLLNLLKRTIRGWNSEWGNVPFCRWAQVPYPRSPEKSVATIKERWGAAQEALIRRREARTTNQWLHCAIETRNGVSLICAEFDIPEPDLSFDKETVHFLTMARVNGKLKGSLGDSLGDIS